MKNVRIRTWIGLALSVAALALIPIDVRMALIVGCVGTAVSMLNLWTAD